MAQHITMQRQIAVFRLLCIGMALFLLASCSSTVSGPREVDYRRGTDSIMMQFLPNAPPEQFYTPSTGEVAAFPVGLRLANNGAADVALGFLTLAVEKDYVNIVGWDLSEPAISEAGVSERAGFSLAGKSDTFPLGDETVALATLQAKPIGPQIMQQDTTVIITACYPYETKASTAACVDTDIFTMRQRQKVCTPRAISLSGGQGGPVAVTSIEERILPQGNDYVRPQFVITIENRGSGSIVNKEHVSEACSSAPLDVADYNVVSVDEVRLSGLRMTRGDISCEPDVARLQGGRGTIRCTVAEGRIPASQDTYQTTIFIELSYGYTTSISKTIRLERADQ